MSDEYYSANTGALLFMGRATSNPLPAPGADIFDEVPLLGSVTPPPKELSVGRFSVQNDRSRRSVGGKLNDQSVSGNIVVDWSEPVHRQIEADANAQQKRNWYILYPNPGARRDDFVGFISKLALEAFDSGEDAKEHRGDFEISVDGAVTVTY